MELPGMECDTRLFWSWSLTSMKPFTSRGVHNWTDRACREREDQPTSRTPPGEAAVLVQTRSCFLFFLRHYDDPISVRVLWVDQSRKQPR